MRKQRGDEKLPGMPMPDRLSFRETQGKLELDGTRVLIVSAFAFGALRRDLISALGPERAKGFLLRYGYECGFHDAAAVRRRLRDDDHRTWGEQAALLHTLEGVARVRIERREFDWSRRRYEVHGVWENSYEAHEHIRFLGVSPDASCWTLMGYAGGYLSAVMGRRVLYKETTCVARGDGECRFVGKTVDLWGKGADLELAYYTESKIVDELDEARERLHHQGRLLKRIAAMHDELTTIALQGRGRNALVEAVGRMLGTAVALEDDELRPLAAWSPHAHGEEDVAPCYIGSVATGDPVLVQNVQTLAKEQRALGTGEHIHPKLKNMYIVPVSAGAEVLGYMTFVRRPDENPVFLRLFAERAAAALGMGLLKERIVLETESRLKGELVEELLSEAASVEALRERVSFMGHDFDRPHRFLVVRIDARGNDAIDPEAMLHRREQLYNLVRADLAHWRRDVHVVNRRSELLVLYYCGADGQTAESLIRRIRKQSSKLDPGLRLSIGVSRECNSLASLRQVFEECEAVLQLWIRTGRPGQVVDVDSLGAVSLLQAGMGRGPLVAYARNRLKPLLDYDKRHGTELVPTLFWYLTLDGNLKQTADALNLSISGLKYRMQRLRDVADINLKDPEERFDLQLALRIVMLAPPEAP